MTTSALFVAGALIFVVGVVHSVLGERRLIGPLVSPEHRRGILEKSAFARGVLRFAWHITTIAWWGMAVALLALASAPLDGQGKLVVLIIATTFAVTGLVTLVSSRGRHLAWPVFMAIAIFSAMPALETAV